MTDEFLTMGLESDRYLKALRLPDQFEDEIMAVLGKFGQRMVDQHPGLFDRTPDPREKTNRSLSQALATHRISYPMNGVRASEPDKNPRLNVHLYWLPPTEYNRTDIDGALRAFGYKIKYADTNIDARVAEQSRNEDWPFEISGNPFDSNIVYYRHVSSTAEIEDAMDTFVDHFSNYGEEYAIGIDD